MSNTVSQFLHDRDEALLSLDEAKIRAYIAKYKVPMNPDGLGFWEGVHLARANWPAAGAAVKEESFAWLLAHGWEPEPKTRLGWRLADPEKHA